jgi:hypothetical protein
MEDRPVQVISGPVILLAPSGQALRSGSMAWR